MQVEQAGKGFRALQCNGKTNPDKKHFAGSEPDQGLKPYAPARIGHKGEK